jgi:pantetheine-phosphate adenylyltransferase
MTEPNERVALFAASFDPLTNGHLDLIHRAQRVFDKVVVAVAKNVDKKGGTFDLEERLTILREVLANEPRVRIETFSELTVDFAEKIGATAVVRGLRAMSDFEYEFEMALMNRHLKPKIEILFMMTSLEHLYVSSSRLKELVRFGADVTEFVPPVVAKRLQEKLGRA